MRVIYRGEPQCYCIFKLNLWYDEDRSRIDPDARVQCDCGLVWILRVPRSHPREKHTWERDETYDITR